MILEYILIDDDILIRKSWEFAAKKKKLKITTFESVESFLNRAENFSKETPIYIDQELGEGLLGTYESLKLVKFGFSKIYLATGFSKKSIKKPDHILAITGKIPPFLK